MTNLGELRRSTTDGKVAGVCVMLADRWQIDPLLVRVAALLLALSSGIGLVLYAAAWALVPQRGSDRAPIDAVFPGVRRVGLKAGIALLAVVCIAAVNIVGGLLPFGVGPALVIGAVWFFGWYRPEQQRRAAAPKAPQPPQLAARPFAESTPFTEAATAWQRRVQDYLAAQAGPPHPAPPTTAHDPGYSLQAYLAHPDPVGLYQPDPKPEPEPASSEPAVAAEVAATASVTATVTKRRTWPMHLIGWFLVLSSAGVVALLDHSYQVASFAYPAAALLAIGLTLILGAWLPRPRGLVIVGALLAIVTAVAATPMPETPSTAVSYANVADLPQGVAAHDTGEHVADLSAIRLDGDATYATQVDVGRIAVVAPPETNIRVVWSVDVGQADVLGLHVADGFDLHDTTIGYGPDPEGPTLTIEARVGLGQLEVTR
ncbi:MAG: PspC domain-containing protein [Propionibacteriaceae bacterium]|nr:PspC domain-containing protein [Propionibacteriaceae bacterium]